ncbi:hypothetical protein CGJ96_23570, partial [Vibrio parahaemolyticus]
HKHRNLEAHLAHKFYLFLRMVTSNVPPFDSFEKWRLYSFNLLPAFVRADLHQDKTCHEHNILF